MSPAKINDLFEILRAACARQFGFNPRQITTRIRYVGPEGHGKDIVQVFRDVGTHSQIVLQGTYATLREKHGDKPHWNDAEKAIYKKTDAELEAAAAARQAELDFTRTCPLYLEHREQLLAHYKAWPGYQAGGVTAREAVNALVLKLTEAQDTQLKAFAEKVGSTEAEHLAHLILATCHLEIEGLPKA